MRKKQKMLNTKSGNAFDKAYADNEVAYHKGGNLSGGRFIDPTNRQYRAERLLLPVSCPF